MVLCTLKLQENNMLICMNEHVLVYLIAAGIISCDIKDTLFRMFVDVADKMLNGEW